MKRTKIFLNGKIRSLDQACISPLDRGLLYGDGVFESLRTFNGKLFQLNEHIKRLLAAARQLKIPRAPSAHDLKQAVLMTLAANNFQETYIKIILTRGLAKEHGLGSKNVLGKPTLLIIAEKLKPPSAKAYAQGWKAVISSLRRPDLPTSRLKSLNYLIGVLAKMEAELAGAEESLLLDSRGNLAEGSISNIFIVKHGIVYTPPLTSPILAGLTRKTVIRLARQSAIRVVEKNISPKELYTADECFITFSGGGVMPVTRIWKKKIGSGRPGSITTSLLSLFWDETKRA
ncbi:MAG: aminotransferase class IV [Candidatus Saganbacteria bacterium]|nr:aminotransferase class IV [Candidatus Saganbacteria bacterium]